MKSPTIERIEKRDAQIASQLKRLSDAAYRLEADLLGLDDFPPLHRTHGDFEDSGTVFFCCRVGTELVGAAEAEVLADGEVNIASLIVTPDHARKGIGRLLVDRILSEYTGSRIVVTPAGGNSPAIALYEKLGFRIVGARDSREGIPLVMLERPAGSPQE